MNNYDLVDVYKTLHNDTRTNNREVGYIVISCLNDCVWKWLVLT